MIRLSRLADYAVVVMTHIAVVPQAVHTAIDVAAATALPVPTAAKVLAKLARGGLLASQRGAKGGYALSRPAQTISVADIVIALDGPIGLTNCTLHGADPCEVEPTCLSRLGVHKINQVMRRALEEMTLADLLPASLSFLAPDRTAPVVQAVARAV